MRLTKSPPAPLAPSAVAAYDAACEIVERLNAQEVTLRDEELKRLKRGEKIEADEIATPLFFALGFSAFALRTPHDHCGGDATGARL
jgi:hypothetical protein